MCYCTKYTLNPFVLRRDLNSVHIILLDHGVKINDITFSNDQTL